MTVTRFVILTDGCDNTQRNLIQEAVKKHAASWWHEFVDVWIVEGGESTAEWRDLLNPIVGLPGSSVLVLVLGDKRPRWAATWFRSKGEWFSSWKE